MSALKIKDCYIVFAPGCATRMFENTPKFLNPHLFAQGHRDRLFSVLLCALCFRST
jgi:hypothetical protein